MSSANRRSILILLAIPLGLIGQPDRVIPASAAREDGALAWKAIERIHPGLGRYTPTSEVAAAFAELERSCARDVTERAFFGRLSRALALLRCSHTKAEPSPAWAAWRATTPTYLPLRLVVHDGCLIVTRSAGGTIRRGDQIVSIDGIDARVILATIESVVPADGWTDEARRFAVGSLSDLDDSELDHFLPAFFPTGREVRLELRAPDAPMSRIVTVPLWTKEERRTRLAEPATPSNLDEAVRLEVLEGGVAILTVGTFVAYRKAIAPSDIYRPFFERIAADEVSTLILDLRDNGGGSDDAAIDLMRFLVSTPFESTSKTWVRTHRFGDLKDLLETWDRSVLDLPDAMVRDLGNGYREVTVGPRPVYEPLNPTFSGRVLALCGPANASGATLFLAGLARRRPVTLVGEPTGGSVDGPTAGVMLFLPLPNTAIKVRIPAVRTVTGLTPFGTPGGVRPELWIRPSLQDLFTGRDVVRERALELARER